MPVEPGWYFARMKTWATYDGWACVKVTQIAPNNPVEVWQCGDTRPWPESAWDFGCRIFPDSENHT